METLIIIEPTIVSQHPRYFKVRSLIVSIVFFELGGAYNHVMNTTLHSPFCNKVTGVKPE